MSETPSPPEWLGTILERLDMVEWDRFTHGEDYRGEVYSVYGWIERDDSYKDFVVLRAWPNTEGNDVGYITSSAEYTEEIYRRIYGEEPEGDDHGECMRVEHSFRIPNAVRKEQTTLTGGDCGV